MDFQFDQKAAKALKVKKGRKTIFRNCYNHKEENELGRNLCAYIEEN